MGKPKTSIIILSKNSESTLEKCLKSVFSQAYKDFEVILIDSGSTDNTVDIAKKFPVRLYEIKPEEFDFGKTRDWGVELARGEYIIFLGADAIPIDNHWLLNIIQPFGDKGVVAVQGYEDLESKKFLWDKPQKNIYEKGGIFYFTREKKKWNKKYKIGLSNVNLAIRRGILLKYPFGNVPAGEDHFLQKRVVEDGFKIVTCEEAKVIHSHDYDLKTLNQRLVREGFGYKLVGIDYTLFDLIIDLCIAIKLYILLAKPLYNQAIKKVFEREKPDIATLAFPILRPIMTYKGNHMKDDKVLKKWLDKHAS